MTHISTMLQAAHDSKPHDFAKAFDAEIAVRLGEALAARRTEIIVERMSAGEKFDNKVYDAARYLKNSVKFFATGAAKGAAKGASVGAKAGVGLGAAAGAVVGGALGGVGGAGIGAIGGIVHHSVTAATEKRRNKRDAANYVDFQDMPVY